MRSFTLLRLVGVIVAFAFAALRNADAWWTGGVLLLTLGLLGYATLASINGRRGWLGFLVACGGYFIAVRVLPEEEKGCLPTSQVIRYIQSRLPGHIRVSTIYSSASTSNTGVTLVSGGGNMSINANSIYIKNNPSPAAASRIPWATLLPGAGNIQEFRSIGQNLSALLFGWLGAVASRRMACCELPMAPSES